MKKILNILIIIMLFVWCESLFAANAQCLAQNRITGQSYSAVGSGETQANAIQAAQNRVLQICKQVNNTSFAGCSIVSCKSY